MVLRLFSLRGDSALARSIFGRERAPTLTPSLGGQINGRGQCPLPAKSRHPPASFVTPLQSFSRSGSGVYATVATEAAHDASQPVSNRPWRRTGHSGTLTWGRALARVENRGIGMDLRWGVVGLALVLLSGCSRDASIGFPTSGGKTDQAATADQGAPAAREATDSDDWSFASQDSAIDGHVIHATRTYEFDDRGTWFSVEFTCVQSSGRVGLSIESYKGQSSASESPGSGFANDVTPNLFGGIIQLPKGRAKPNGLNVVPLGQLFGISDTYGNRLELKRPGAADVARLPAEWQGLSPEVLNVARQVKDMLPLSVEVMNDMGTSELVIDPSNQVVQTLRACGGDNDLIPAEAIAQLQVKKQAQEQKQQEQQAAEDAQASERAAQQAESAKEHEAAAHAELAQDCRSHGVVMHYVTGGAPDCASQFSGEFGAFNADVDAIFAVAAKHGFLCAGRGTRADVVRRANQVGLGAAQAMVQQEWCSNLLKVDVSPADTDYSQRAKM